MLLDSQEPTQRYCDDAWCVYLTEAALECTQVVLWPDLTALAAHACTAHARPGCFCSHTPTRRTLDLAALARTRLPGACLAELARLLLDRRDVGSDIILTDKLQAGKEPLSYCVGITEYTLPLLC